jgi:hypothetical protein
VVAEGNHHVISGAFLPFSADAAELLFAGLRDALRLKKRDVLRPTRDQLLGCAPVFTSARLFTELSLVLTPAQTQFSNSDGDEMMFHDLRFPLADGVVDRRAKLTPYRRPELTPYATLSSGPVPTDLITEWRRVRP